MNDRLKVEAIVNQFFEAINSDDLSTLPLAQNVEMNGILMSEPLVGEAEVRHYLQEAAPFMQNIHSTRMIIENGTAAALTEFDVVNGVHITGAYIVDIKDDHIIGLNGLFDTRPIFAKD